MFLGEYGAKTGAHHRLALPKPFRSDLGSPFIVTRGYEGCVMILPLPTWEAVTADVVAAPLLLADARASVRFLLSGASEVATDEQGRFVLSTVLAEHADLRDEAVFVGLGRWIELWSTARWAEHLARLQIEGPAIADRLVSRDGDRS